MKMLGYLFAMFVTMGLSLCVMLFGWGLRPESWGWVIWGNIGAVLVGGILNVAASHD